MTEVHFEEEKVRLNAFDHRNLAQNCEREANQELKAREYGIALRSFVKARDHYIVWGASDAVQRCQKGIDICLVKLGKLDPEYLKYL